MATDVETGRGEFWLDDAASLSTKLGEVFEIPIPTGAAELIDASHFDTVGFRDYITARLRDGEEADVVLNWVPNSATDILCVAAIGQTRDFAIRVYQDTGVYIFTGSVLVRDYVRTNPLDDRRTGTLRVKWVSAITESWDATP
jgi:hypothetical protein